MDGYPFPLEGGNFVAFHAFHTIVLGALAAFKPRPKDNPIMTIKYAGRVRFGQTVEGTDGPIYVEDPAKSDYANYTVLMGDGSDIEPEQFDWDTDIKPDARKKGK
jgi:hypothetical protein